MTPDTSKWTERLAGEDLAFIKRFVLASGSLKAVAAEYGISYPTVRLRLDRLIAKIRVFEDSQIRSDFERYVRALFADGRIDGDTMKQLLAMHQQDLQAQQELDQQQGKGT